MIEAAKQKSRGKQLAMMLVVVAVLSVKESAADVPGDAVRRPNILVIMTDDQGWGDLSGNGNVNLKTPNIEGLAKQGAVLERFYVCPVCSPTRAEFLTGRYHWRSGVFSTSSGGERMNPEERTIAEAFQAAGYRTAAFGKWHNGTQAPYHPNSRGFDEFYGFCSGHWGTYWNPMLERNGEPVTGEGFITDDLTSQAIAFIERDEERPFFVYVPYNTPHSPMQVPNQWWDRFKDKELQIKNREPEKEDIQHIRAALAMCENIDWNVGRLMDSLRSTGKEENTIVIYFSDNGPNGVRWNGDMKGRKGSTDEGGVRSPGIIRWPAVIQASTRVTDNVSVTDLYPTLTAMAGIQVKHVRPLDGVDQSAVIREGKTGSDRMIISHWNRRVSVKWKEFRLDNEGQLFDLSNDPGQRKPVNEKYPEVVNRLQQEQAVARAEIQAAPRSEQQPYPIGYSAQPTWLPARDAHVTGDIRRSNRFPNSSYFENWVNQKDTIYWETDVKQAGVYEVELFYGCSKGQEGSEFVLTGGGGKLKFALEKSFPTEIIGTPYDRVPRAESEEKAWGRMNIGRIKLKSGVTEMTLQCSKLSKQQAMEFRMLIFRKQD